MGVKHCAWGTCTSDSRDKEKEHMRNVKFYSFPKPDLQNDFCEKTIRCRNWIKACGRLPKKCTLNIPAFSHGKALGAKALRQSRKIASIRIHVERAIHRIKTFKVLNGIIPLKLRYLLDQIVTIVAVLCNLQERLI